ncbi:MAG TPA: VOC family protein [Solirubrobacteraceae bacterium]|nr:VOC family protein [Solirubrobacteraceae bacterium]
MTTSTSLITGVDFVSIPATDLRASMDFYENVLGLEAGKTWGQENPLGAEYETGTVTLALIDVARLGIEFGATSVPIAFQVDDVPAAREQLEAKGVEFVTDLIDSGVCHQAIFKDPAGNSLGLHHRYA